MPAPDKEPSLTHTTVSSNMGQFILEARMRLKHDGSIIDEFSRTNVDSTSTIGIYSYDGSDAAEMKTWTSDMHVS